MLTLRIVRLLPASAQASRLISMMGRPILVEARCDIVQGLEERAIDCFGLEQEVEAYGVAFDKKGLQSKAISR